MSARRKRVLFVIFIFLLISNGLSAAFIDELANLPYDKTRKELAEKYARPPPPTPYEIIAKKNNFPVTVLIKMFLPYIHELQMLLNPFTPSNFFRGEFSIWNLIDLKGYALCIYLLLTESLIMIPPGKRQSISGP